CGSTAPAVCASARDGVASDPCARVGRIAGWDRSDRSGRPWSVRYPAIRATNADRSTRGAGRDGRKVERRARSAGESQVDVGPRGVITGSRAVQAPAGWVVLATECVAGRVWAKL